MFTCCADQVIKYLSAVLPPGRASLVNKTGSCGLLVGGQGGTRGPIRPTVLRAGLESGQSWQRWRREIWRLQLFLSCRLCHELRPHALSTCSHCPFTHTSISSLTNYGNPYCVAGTP